MVVDSTLAAAATHSGVPHENEADQQEKKVVVLVDAQKAATTTTTTTTTAVVQHQPEAITIDINSSINDINSSSSSNNNNNNNKPDAVRRTTHPPTRLLNSSDYVYPVRPRPLQSSSPYPRPHLRSKSHASALAVPPLAPRAHSLPSVHSASHQYPPPPPPSSSSPLSLSPSASPLLRPSSPMASSLSPRQQYSPNMRPTSPFRPRSPLDDTAFQSISEDAELDLTTPSHYDNTNTHSNNNNNNTNTSHPTPFARPLSVRRQRPSSPLHSLAPPPATSARAAVSTPYSSSSSSSSISPLAPPLRFNEGFPSLHHYASNSSFSSISSTPSTARSRSPSISSLETIEDNPDLEWEAAAIEADRKGREDEHDQQQGRNEVEPRRRGSLEIPGHRSVGFGFGRRGADAGRKRWSICGGERTVDLDLETIWED